MLLTAVSNLAPRNSAVVSYTLLSPVVLFPALTTSDFFQPSTDSYKISFKPFDWYNRLEIVFH